VGNRPVFSAPSHPPPRFPKFSSGPPLRQSFETTRLIQFDCVSQTKRRRLVRPVTRSVIHRPVTDLLNRCDAAWFFPILLSHTYAGLLTGFHATILTGCYPGSASSCTLSTAATITVHLEGKMPIFSQCAVSVLRILIFWLEAAFPGTRSMREDACSGAPGRALAPRGTLDGARSRLVDFRMCNLVTSCFEKQSLDKILFFFCLSTPSSIHHERPSYKPANLNSHKKLPAHEPNWTRTHRCIPALYHLPHNLHLETTLDNVRPTPCFEFALIYNASISLSR
jgi:hypothetical protein